MSVRFEKRNKTAMYLRRVRSQEPRTKNKEQRTKTKEHRTKTQEPRLNHVF